MRATHAARPAGRSCSAARLRGERGAAAVEFALVVPLLLVILLGIIAASQAFQTQARLTAAAREGARVVALSGTTTTTMTDATAAATAAVQSAAGDLGISASQITFSRPSCPSTAPTPTGPAATDPTATVTVTIAYNGSFGAGLFGAAGLDLTGKAVMRCGG
ncbi:TadE/TadG family type IV pilus assembly protein [Modestobacter sp. L9-4]|uniref:TadE/TadG family type IV pilus assembly protein n=1 Tax=Modestobacter sp. L9-4 TaxID=2851567 RepID=UPI001F2D74D6|nr:TadE/TadG family type IV pilus assembly protein [Modestobacter sp. L9-4]